MDSDFQSIGANPTGFLGWIAGLLMNAIHASQYKRIITNILEGIETNDAISILDIGCGGGKAIRLFHSLVGNAHIDGVDISPDMVALGKKLNKKGVRSGQVNIVQGDVTALPYPDHCYNIVTAFDTINFWTDFDQAMSEIGRVLKETGVFVIVNGYPGEGSKWHEFVKFKNSDEYRDMLAAHGFRHIRITIQKNTIIIKANKQ